MIGFRLYHFSLSSQKFTQLKFENGEEEEMQFRLTNDFQLDPHNPARVLVLNKNKLVFFSIKEPYDKIVPQVFNPDLMNISHFLFLDDNAVAVINYFDLKILKFGEDSNIVGEQKIQFDSKAEGRIFHFTYDSSTRTVVSVHLKKILGARTRRYSKRPPLVISLMKFGRDRVLTKRAVFLLKGQNFGLSHIPRYGFSQGRFLVIRGMYFVKNKFVSVFIDLKKLRICCRRLNDLELDFELGFNLNGELIDSDGKLYFVNFGRDLVEVSF